MKRTIRILALASIVPFLGACAGTGLEPAPEAATVEGDDAAVASQGSVRLTADPNEWPGDAGVTTGVLPIRITIRNGSEDPVRVRYDQFELVSESGERYSALPPFQIEGTVREPAIVRGYIHFHDLGWTHHDFHVVPYYSGLYPGLPVWNHGFLDPYYFDTYGAYDRVWALEDLPTPEMLRRALPEGVIQPGGNVSGFLNFEKLDDTVDRVELHADLVNADSGQTLSELEIPFQVGES